MKIISIEQQQNQMKELDFKLILSQVVIVNKIMFLTAHLVNPLKSLHNHFFLVFLKCSQWGFNYDCGVFNQNSTS